MGAEPKFGSQSCPIELENEEDEDNGGLWSDKKKKALMKPSLSNSTNMTMIDTDPLPLSTRLEIVPFNNQSPSHEPSPSRNSVNPKITAPMSPSIEDLANARVAESGNHSPGDPENPGSSEGLWALDDATHGGTLPATPCGFKRLLKGHKNSVGNGEAEHKSGTDGGSSQKTELQREMELYEAAEREEEAHLLTSLRHHQSGDCSPSSKSPNSMESIQADWKHVPGSSSGEQPRAKRGRRAGTTSQALRKEEDVCFACFDGGDLILCDKRFCPKAYHMDCTGRESEFFRKKGQWFCGWHVCAHCSRFASLHCYTCPNAYCHACVTGADFLSLRKNRGLCEQCYRIVYMIENNLSVDSEGDEVNFDDEETYECLFRDYWKDVKEKLSLSWSGINKAFQAKDEGEPLGNGVHIERMTDDEDSSDSDCRPAKRLTRKRAPRNAAVGNVGSSDSEEEEQEEEEEVEEEEEEESPGKSRRGRQKKCEEVKEEEEEEETPRKTRRGRQKKREFVGWASKELLNFLDLMKEDAEKPLPLLYLNKLVLSYIEANKLINPRRRGQIRCDQRLQNLFGKKHVGKLEMMKLLNKHIASKRVTNAAKLDNADENSPKQRKSRKKLDETKHLKSDPSNYAAVDVNNISLIYLKRSLLEDLQKDPNFESKVTGAFVRIRVPSVVNKNDTCYRLVQVVGIRKASHPRGSTKMANVLEILNLKKREEITIDLISGQDFTEEECQRLRQSMKCGLLKAMTVGELREKAKVLREAKVKDWFSTELLRLGHLRDRASEKGLKKGLRECVERLEVLNSSSEMEKQLRAPIEVNEDPCMDPNYESDNAGNRSPLDMGLLENQWDRKNNGWAEAGLHPGKWEAKSKVSDWGGQKDTNRDNYHAGKPVQQECSATSAEKKIWGGNWRTGLPDDKVPADHHATSLDRRASFSQKGPSDPMATGMNAQESFTQKKEDGGGEIDDDGWGGDFEGNQQDNGWGDNLGDTKKLDHQDLGWKDSVADMKKSDGWGNEGDDFKSNDGWGGGRSTLDKWAGDAVDTPKTVGGEADGGIKKDDGWNGNVEGLGKHARNQKKNTWGSDGGDGMKGPSWGSSLGASSNHGCRDRGGDSQKQEGWGPNACASSHNSGWVNPGGEAQNKGGQVRSPAVQSHNAGWGHPGGCRGKDDGWGHTGGGSGHDDDDGWGCPAGGEIEGGWGNSAGNNEKPISWGVEVGGNEAKSGGAERNNRSWNSGFDRREGKPRADTGSFRDVGFNQREGKPRADTGSFRDVGFNQREGKPRADTGNFRDVGFNQREGKPRVFRDAGFEWREGKLRPDFGPPYREPGGFGRGHSAHKGGAVPVVAVRTGASGVGVAAENERDKIWYYQDPSKTTQGPFSMEQLRKWEKTNLFPLSLRIWRATEGQDASILLTDALQGRFRNDLPPGFDHPGRGARDDVRDAHGSCGNRPGSNWQDKWGRPPKQNDWVPERRHSSDGGEGVRSERAWGLQELDKHPRCDGEWDTSRGHWDRGSNHGNPSDHHHSSSRPGYDGRPSVRKRDFPCRYFARGMCKKGDECNFMH